MKGSLAENMDLRREVRYLLPPTKVRKMKLRHNRYKDTSHDSSQLLDHLESEVRELREVIERGGSLGEVLEECADCSNMVDLVLAENIRVNSGGMYK